MSWGERSCIYYGKGKKPCSPSLGTCNPFCPMYKSNGKHPDWDIDPDSVNLTPYEKKSFIRFKPTKKQIKKLKRKGKIK